MKKFILAFFFLLQGWCALSQGWLQVSGSVSDIDSGLPVVFHPVIIVSDSSNGFIYYNVVFTDSTGVYYDNIPLMADTTGILFVQTMDCNFEMQIATLYYSPGNDFLTHDFEICTDITICQAWFSYYPEPPDAVNSYRFINESTGDINSWLWTFGDGSTSQEQNPLHVYNSTGVFEVCLTIFGVNCSDTFCQSLVISDTLYGQLYGQVFAGNFPLQTGEVALYAMNPQGGFMQLGDRFPVDSNGIFYFTTVPQGQYLLQAFPFDSPSFVPTYYGNVISWQNAAVINILDPGNPFNIHLSPASEMGITGGPGSITGQVSQALFSGAFINEIIIFLLDESFVPHIYTGLDPSGAFSFQSLDTGTYILKAELAGIYSDYIRIDITQEKPHHDVNLSFDGNSILGNGELAEESRICFMGPNPVSDWLTLSCYQLNDEDAEVSVYSLTGTLLYREIMGGINGKESLSIPFGGFPGGIYIIRVNAGDGSTWSEKIVKH